MPSSGRDELTVYVDAVDIGPIRKVGTLRRDRAGGRTVLSFAFEPAWLTSKAAFAIDPALGLYEGEQALRELPGIFADASPDRWGRVLMERREAVEARQAGRRPRGLDEWDFLVGANDGTRMGGLRRPRRSRTSTTLRASRLTSSSCSGGPRSTYSCRTATIISGTMASCVPLAGGGSHLLST